MTIKYVGILVVALVVVGGGFLLLNKNQSGPSVLSSGPGNVAAAASSTPVKFPDSRYAANAYLISATSTYDAATQKALLGFQVKKQTLSDGSLQIKLVALKSEYATQTYVVKPGEKLYFVESAPKDDSTDEDKFPGDDRALLVSADGFILNPN